MTAPRPRRKRATKPTKDDHATAVYRAIERLETIEEEQRRARAELWALYYAIKDTAHHALREVRP